MRRGALLQHNRDYEATAPPTTQPATEKIWSHDSIKATKVRRDEAGISAAT